jgi:demethylmenaquinone methyltransferase/2-methoxy-6-polyprenyl-1,4-benzoquinol methylase
MFGQQRLRERRARPWLDEMMPEDSVEDTHFGFSTVPLPDKQRRVDDVFHKVAARYDLMNDLMSAGLHRLWKDLFAAAVHPSKTRPFRHLDVAGGTGDVGFRIAKAGGPKTQVTLLDINPDMLAVGRQRAVKKGLAEKLTFIEANAESLPFPDNEFDAYTIAFGIRNVPRIEQALKEAYRVLRRGGHFLCLEFSQVDIASLDRVYEAYSFHAIPAIGKLVTGDGEAYRYLVESIRRFPTAEDFRALIEGAGFARTTFTKLSGGVVAIHSGWKL